MKKFLLLILVFSLLIFSCILETDDSLPPSKKNRTFWAQDFKNGVFYRVSAEWLAYNSHCEIWVEKSSGVTTAQAQAVAKTYKDNVYVKLMKSLGWNATYNKKIINTMQYSDILGDNNGRLIILLLDIKDEYVKGVNEGFVAGYFDAANFFSESSLPAGYKSNNCDMIYMDINPTKVGSELFNNTLAHEMQHLMNFVTSVAFRVTGNTINEMDIWLNEGLSAAAEWVYSGKANKSWVDWYNSDTTNLIRKGDNFYLWNNEEYKTTPDYILNDYATVNLFFSWLRLQYGKDVYGKIFNSDYTDYRAITLYTDYSTNAASWAALMGNWHAANFINHPSNRYGYKNDSVLKNVKAKHIKSGDFIGTTYSLFPGEAVYSYSAAGRTRPANVSPIFYSNLTNTEASAANIPAGGTLLTYNANISSLNAANGTITGDSPPAASIQPFVRAAVQEEHSSDSILRRIDAGDLIRRNGFEPLIINEMPFTGIKGQLMKKEDNFE